MLTLIDTSAEHLPLKADVQALIQLDAEQRAACIERCRRVLASVADTLLATGLGIAIHG